MNNLKAGAEAIILKDENQVLTPYIMFKYSMRSELFGALRLSMQFWHCCTLLESDMRLGLFLIR